MNFNFKLRGGVAAPLRDALHTVPPARQCFRNAAGSAVPEYVKSAIWLVTGVAVAFLLLIRAIRRRRHSSEVAS